MEQRPEHEQDVILVRNILVDDDFYDEEENYSYADKFQVRWNGTPFSIKAGGERLFPRYIAKHFAKHLADRVLTLQAQRGSYEPRLNSATERPKILQQILVGVHEYYGDEPEYDEGKAAAEKVEQINAVSIGKIPDPMVGNLRPDPKPTSEILEEAKNNPDPITEEEKQKEELTGKRTATKEQLLLECARLDIPVTGKESRPELLSKLKAFTG